MPEDIRRKALLGDHWETLNPDRPDTKSAYGNEEAKIFHSVMGDVASAGGEAAWRVSLDDAIGAGSNGSSGKGGGWDVGGGTGSFGCRTGGGRTLMVKRHDGERATEAAADPPQPAAPVWTAEAVAAAKARFLAEVAGRIQKAKQYPSEARRLGAEGKVRIEFIISAGGEVLAARLAVSSGHALLDSEGLAMIHRAGPYPGIPEELGLTSIQLVLPIGFELEAER
jgi:TonB family protein